MALLDKLEFASDEIARRKLVPLLQFVASASRMAM